MEKYDSMRRFLRPRIDHLESRVFMSATPTVARPMFEVSNPGVNNSPPSGAYTPAQIEQAYGFNEITLSGVVGSGSGETIAIVDAYNDPKIQADLNTFDTQFGLPATTVAVYNQTGGTSYPGSDPTGDWELEESLDVEWAHAMAPAASIMLVEASTDNNSDLLTAVNYAAMHANVVSMSWGGSEFSDETADDSDFDQAGVVFVASSGDVGAPISWPASSPNVLSVGGTALAVDANKNWSSEAGWSGSGGGPSAYESQPSYQKGVVTQTSTMRADPDVAYDASPSTGFAVYDSVKYEGTSFDWIQVGGTSAGAPQWSALLAIADQGLARSGQPALNSTSAQQVMTTLYQNPQNFHDITSGTSTGSPNYSAGPGYDYVTGLGSPMANLIVGSLDGSSASSDDMLLLAAPDAVTAGTSFNLTVTADSSGGPTDTHYRGTIQFTSSDIQAGLPANYTFTTNDNGVHTFSVTLPTAGMQSIVATDKAMSSITGIESNIAVRAASASILKVTGFPTMDTAGAGGDLVMTAYDAYGNVATDYTGAVSLTSSDPQAVLVPFSYTFAGATGTHTFGETLETAGTQSFTATDAVTASITGTESGITVQPGAASSLKVTEFPTSDTAGAAGDVVVTACDVYGNVATGYTGTVSLTSSDPQAVVVPSSYTFAGTTGTHTFNVTLETAGTQTITATDRVTSSLTGTESNITVTAAAASTLKVTGFPTSDTAGTANGVFVTAYDAYGNVANDYNGTVSLTSSDPYAALPPAYTFVAADAGQHSFGVTLDTSGTQSIGAADTAMVSIKGSESGITVQAAAANRLAIAGIPTTVTAGAGDDVTVTAYDAYGNAATAYTGTVALTSNDPHPVVPSSYTFASSGQGTHTFFVTLDTAGAYSLTVTDRTAPSLTATESNITVQAAAARVLAVTGFPSTEMAGVASDVTVTAYDAYGNFATGYTGTISFNSSDAQALLPFSYSFVAADAGTRAFSVTLETAGTQSITTTDTAASDITGTEAGIAVRATPQITWNTAASIVYGTPLGAAQLDASADVPGTFTYTPAAAAILNAGSGQTFSVTFTPWDTTDYTTAAGTTTLTVTKATPTLEVTDIGGRFDGSPFPAAATIAGVDHTLASSLDNVTPTLAYYDGSGTAGTSLGSTPPWAPGTYTVVAAFPDNDNYSAALSAPVTFTIGQHSATLALTSSGGSAVYGQSVSFTTTVGSVAGTPSGTVIFYDGNTQLATVPLDGSGMATLTASALSAGSHSINATYSGNADLEGVQAAPYSETVAQTGTEVVVVQNPDFENKKRTLVRRTSVRLIVEITPSAPGGGIPTGEVTFELLKKSRKKVKVTTLGRAPVSGGEATLTFKASDVLKKPITIVYSGDTNDKASTVTTPSLT